ncbi:MAG TPA: hypothetical protein VIJ04_05890 [Xanthobacteraceae bacterium]
MADMATATGLAGGVLVGALLETLMEKGIFDLADCRAILDRGINSLGPLMQTPNGIQAAQIIGAMKAGKFSARG